jgi:N-acetylglucosaminyldiphosphoundecaprenol N-acetyl-beta-D-mannosaminyltransferase
MNTVIDFCGVKVDNVTQAEAIEKVRQFLSTSHPHMIFTPNPEIIVSAQNDQALRNILNAASLRVPDGISMVVVSKILGNPLKERIGGIDLMTKIVELSGREGYRLFLLGSAPGVAQKAAQILIQKYAVKIVGTNDGYFSDDLGVINKIKASGADIVFVGLGAGRQERWLNRHLNELGVKIGMTIGGSLDVISGNKKRAPQWIQALYLEWLYRLITQPDRWKRQLALPKFLWLMLFKRPK